MFLEIWGLCLNARNITNIFLEQEAAITSGGYDIVGITETLLGDEDGDLYNIEGFKRMRKDRFNKRGGGVAVFVRENLHVQQIPEIYQPSEDIWNKLIGEQEEGLGVCYRPYWNSKVNSFVFAIHWIQLGLR